MHIFFPIKKTKIPPVVVNEQSEFVYLTAKGTVNTNATIGLCALIALLRNYANMARDLTKRRENK
jgi:hypothetical protein